MSATEKKALPNPHPATAAPATAGPQPPTPLARGHVLKNGHPAHQLTAEDRRKGGLRSQERRREIGMGILERIARKLDEKADRIVDATLQEAEEGDWRAFEMLLEHTFGRPVQAITGADGGPIELEVSAVRERLAERLAEVSERSGEGL